MNIDGLKVIGNKLVLEYKLKKDETYKVNNKTNIFSVSIYKKPQRVRGISSMCEDGKHVFFLDYDGVCKWIVETELEELSLKLKSPFYLFCTKEEIIEEELVGHYHAICLTKLLPKDIVRLQDTTSCDKAYTSMPLRNRFRSWVLRLSDKKGSNKPEYVGCCGYQEIVYPESSSAHLKLLASLYDLPKIDYRNLDGLSKIYLNEYETR
jgi:hypothetical protein